MLKFVLGVNRKHLTVSPEVHALVKLYAQERRMTITEATYQLLRKAFAVEEGLELEEEERIDK